MTNLWIKDRLEELKAEGSHKNLAGLARALGHEDQSKLSKTINGPRRIQVDEFDTIAEYLEISLDEAYRLSNPLKKTPNQGPDRRPEKEHKIASNRPQPLGITQQSFTPRAIPVRSIASANLGEGAIMIVDDAVDEVACPPGLAGVKDLYAVEISGDCLTGVWEHGDPVFASPNVAPRKGDVVVFTLKNGNGNQEAYVKILVSYDENELVVRQTNPEKEMHFPSRDIMEVHRVYTYRECIRRG